MSGVWSKIANLFRGGSAPDPVLPPKDEPVLSLWRRCTELLATEASDLLGVDEVVVQPIKPGQALDVGGARQSASCYGLVITFPDGSRIVVNLDTVSQRLGPNPSPEAVKEEIRTWAPGGGAPADVGWQDASARLLPRLIAASEPPARPGRPWGDMAVATILDDQKQIWYVNDGLLAEWERSQEEVYATALANLRRRFGTAAVNQLPPDRSDGLNIWYLEAEDTDINATLVLLPELIAKVPVPLDEMFVAIPDRNTALIVQRPETREERQGLALWVAELCLTSSSPLTPYLLVWSEGVLIRASAEDLWGVGVHLFPSEERQAGGYTLVAVHPETGERFRLYYPFRYEDD